MFYAELVDFGDKWSEWGGLGFDSNLTATNFIHMCQQVKDIYPLAFLLGPGTTANASADWYRYNKEISNQCSMFSYRAVVFPDPSLLTIPNLLSDNYTT